MKKTIKVILISLFCLVLLIGIAGYVALTQVDFNRYKNIITKAVYNATGRELTIGNIKVKPSIRPAIELQDVTLSNAKWSKNPLMVSVKSADVVLSVLPLLHKNYEINRFAVHGAEIYLEENAKGQANWQFGVPEVKEEPKKVSFLKEISLVKNVHAAEEKNEIKTGDADIFSSLVVRQVELENVKISYTDKKAKTQVYTINKLNLDENSDDNIDYDFDVNNGLYRGKGSFGALKLINSAKGFPFNGELNVMGIDVKADMMLFDLLGKLTYDGQVEAANFIGKNSGYNEQAKVSLKGSLSEVNADVKSFKLAGNEIKGTVKADLAGKVPSVTAKLSSPKIDIASFGQKKAAWDFSLIKEAKATTLAPATEIPYAMLYSVNANVWVNVNEIINGSSEIAKNLEMNALVNNGKATVKIVKGTVANGAVTADMVLNAASKGLNLKADVKKLNLRQLLTNLNANSGSFNLLSGSDSDIAIDLNGVGNTYAAVVDSLSGRIVMIVDKSQVHLGNIGMMKGNIISQLFNTLNLTKGNDDLNLSCAVVRADLKNGKAELPNGLVVNADKFTIVANGDINLKNDAISLSIKPFAGKLTDTNIAKALSSLVKLTGTLQNPRIGVDSANAIKTIVGVTTAGPVYLGAQMLLENDGSPCYTALEGTGFENRFPKPGNVVNQTTGDVGKILDDSVDVVKDATKGILNILSGGAKK